MPNPPSATAVGSRAGSAELSMLLVCAIWGVNFSVLKYALQTLPPFALTAIRFTIASITLGLVARALEPATPMPWRLRIRLAGLGLLGNSIYQLGFMTGLTRTTAGNSALLIASTPLVTAVLGSWFGVERLTRAVRIAIAVGTAGVVLVVVAKSDGVGLSLQTLTGDLLTLSAVLCWSAFTHGVRAVHAHTTPLRVTAWTTIGGTPLLIAVGWPDLVRLEWTEISLLTWGAVLYAAFFSLVIAYVVWNRSVVRIGGSRTALYGVTVPVFALATAALVLGEKPTLVQLVGAALILGSVVLNVLGHAREAANGGRTAVPASDGG